MWRTVATPAALSSSAQTTQPLLAAICRRMGRGGRRDDCAAAGCLPRWQTHRGHLRQTGGERRRGRGACARRHISRRRALPRSPGAAACRRDAVTPCGAPDASQLDGGDRGGPRVPARALPLGAALAIDRQAVASPRACKELRAQSTHTRTSSREARHWARHLVRYVLCTRGAGGNRAGPRQFELMRGQPPPAAP